MDKALGQTEAAEMPDDDGKKRRRSSSAQRALRSQEYRAKLHEVLGMPRPGETVAGKYRVDEVLGVGGMGAVFAATHTLTNKRVALKWLLPSADELEEAERRLLREAQATAQIDHPNVVNVFDVGRHAAGLFLVMELLRGESLAQCMEREALPPAAAIAVLLPALSGVAAAHRRGVIHRDLKPENIFLCRSAEGDYRDSKVLDFGISKFSGGEDMTVTGTIMGTPWYMAPEQIRGSKHLDARADIYAIGVMLYELLGDGNPFEADSIATLMFKIAMESPRPLSSLKSDLDPALVAVVERAMAKDPAERYESVEALIEALWPFADPSLAGGTGRSGVIPRVSDAALAQTVGPSRVPAVGSQERAAIAEADTWVSVSDRADHSSGHVRRIDEHDSVVATALRTTHPGRRAAARRLLVVLLGLGLLGGGLWTFAVLRSKPAASSAPAAAPISGPSEAQLRAPSSGTLAGVEEPAAVEPAAVQARPSEVELPSEGPAAEEQAAPVAPLKASSVRSKRSENAPSGRATRLTGKRRVQGSTAAEEKEAKGAGFRAAGSVDTGAGSAAEASEAQPAKVVVAPVRGTEAPANRARDSEGPSSLPKDWDDLVQPRRAPRAPSKAPHAPLDLGEP